ncbi:transposase family protein [Micromonosporaceae bacterium B7E4]
MVAAAVCAAVAGYRSYAAIGEWVADLPADTAAALGIDADRRPSEAMIRRLLQALDADRLAMVIGAWLAGQLPAPPAGTRRAITVDGKTLRGSRTGDTVARHVLAAADQATEPAEATAGSSTTQARASPGSRSPPSAGTLIGSINARNQSIASARPPARMRSQTEIASCVIRGVASITRHHACLSGSVHANRTHVSG